jgi:hypothetical protein
MDEVNHKVLRTQERPGDRNLFDDRMVNRLAGRGVNWVIRNCKVEFATGYRLTGNWRHPDVCVFLHRDNSAYVEEPAVLFPMAKVFADLRKRMRSYEACEMDTAEEAAYWAEFLATEAKQFAAHAKKYAKAK